MLKKFLPFAILILLISACNCGSEKAAVNEDENLVELVSNEAEVPVIPLNEFDEKAGSFVDKEVMVSGIVDHVCKHGGKKLFLVDDGGDLHVVSQERFNDDLNGSKVEVKGIVRELRIDEAYCLKMEEDNIQSHREGMTSDELYERKMNMINSYRDSMKEANSNHLSFYSLEFVSLNKLN